MIDPITRYILQESSLDAPSEAKNAIHFANGFPGGKNIKKQYEIKSENCRKKAAILKKQGNKDEAHKYDWKCGTAALCEFDKKVIDIIKKYGPTFCNKYNGKEKKDCMDYIRGEIGNRKHECDIQKRDMEAELGS
jgi:hypothetical protein